MKLPRRQRGRTRDPEKFRKNLERKIARKALRIVRPRIDSKTLRKGLHILDDTINDQTVLAVPHYWAVYYHDGTRAARKRSGFYVWFPDKEDDPRTQGGARAPTRFAQTRHLTEEQWKRGLRENRLRAKQGRKPYMIVKRFIGPRPPHPFFENLNLHLNAEIEALVDREFSAFLSGQIPTDYGVATARL